MARLTCLDLELQAVTPLWLGGASYQAELRAPSLRGCLRFWFRALAGGLLGGALLGQQKYADAERLLVASYEGMKRREAKILPESKFRLTEALERLVQLYNAWGKKDKADEWRKNLNAAKVQK